MLTRPRPPVERQVQTPRCQQATQVPKLLRGMLWSWSTWTPKGVQPPRLTLPGVVERQNEWRLSSACVMLTACCENKNPHHTRLIRNARQSVTKWGSMISGRLASTKRTFFWKRAFRRGQTPQTDTSLPKYAFCLGETHVFKKTCVSSRPNARKSWTPIL